jgi:hypothetical protein
MSRFTPVRREVAALLVALRKRVPQFTSLPFLVSKATWETTGDDDTAPDVTEWNMVTSGQKPDALSDWPGYEERNRTVNEQSRGTRMFPKVYLGFDPDAELFSEE